MNPSPDLAEFIGRIQDDPALLELLGREKSPDGFSAACADAGENLGLRVDAAEVSALIQQRALVWFQRHIL